MFNTRPERLAIRRALDNLMKKGVKAGETSPVPLLDDGVTYESFVEPMSAPVTDLTGRPIDNNGQDPTWIPSHGSKQ